MTEKHGSLECHLMETKFAERTLHYTHATDEAKRRAVENLVRPVASSDESVTNEKGRVAALP
ncbi:MAG TPA: hypothetical protein VJ023_13985 [Pyrinomonadaceae bacterium]|nr:hypothetical protein [Pyrinomonadaceae bacterium]